MLGKDAQSCPNSRKINEMKKDWAPRKALKKNVAHMRYVVVNYIKTTYLTYNILCFFHYVGGVVLRLNGEVMWY